MGAPIDLVGCRYGRLVVTGKAPRENKSDCIRWECKCDCGGSVPRARSDLLRAHSIMSCGCLRRDRSRAWCLAVNTKMGRWSQEREDMKPYQTPSGNWRIRWRSMGMNRGATFPTKALAQQAAQRVMEVGRGRKAAALEANAEMAVAEKRPLPEVTTLSPFITKQELSAYLRVPIGTIDSWVYREEIPFVRLTPGTTRFEKVAIEAWIKKGVVDSGRAPEGFADVMEAQLCKRLPGLTATRIKRAVGYALRPPPRFGLSEEAAEAIEASRLERKRNATP